MTEFFIYSFSESMSVLVIALGFHLIFGLGGVIYLCYGAFLILGAYVVAALFQLGTGIILSVFAGIGLTSFLSLIFYRAVLSRVQGVLLNEALVCLGVMLLITDALSLTFGTAPFTFPRLWPARIVSISGSVFEISRMGIIGAAPLVCLLIWAFLKYSLLGKAMRAICQDRDAALLMGISPTNLIGRMVVSTSTCIVQPDKILDSCLEMERQHEGPKNL